MVQQIVEQIRVGRMKINRNGPGNRLVGPNFLVFTNHTKKNYFHAAANMILRIGVVEANS